MGESLGNLKPCMNSSTTVSKKETNMFNKEKYNPHIRGMVACVNPAIVQEAIYNAPQIFNEVQKGIHTYGPQILNGVYQVGDWVINNGIKYAKDTVENNIKLCKRYS